MGKKRGVCISLRRVNILAFPRTHPHPPWRRRPLPATALPSFQHSQTCDKKNLFLVRLSRISDHIYKYASPPLPGRRERPYILPSLRPHPPSNSPPPPKKKKNRHAPASHIRKTFLQIRPSIPRKGKKYKPFDTYPHAHLTRLAGWLVVRERAIARIIRRVEYHTVHSLRPHSYQVVRTT